MTESRDFEDLFASLNAHEVRYLVVGGYAVAIHARPRFTDDLDLFISRAAENATRLTDALADFGYGPPEVAPDRFLRPNRIIQLGIPPHRVDILTSIKGVTFDACWTGRMTGKYGGQEVSFIGRSDLVASKEAAGKDLEDLRLLGVPLQS